MRRRTQQSGAALMAMLAVLVLGASWWLVSALSTPVSRVALEREHNARVLAEAKQALLGWAARNAFDNTDNNPGRLPCPEPAGSVGNPATEGIMQNVCGAAVVIGRLPWRSLGLPKLFDAKGEPLWYVVSSGWKLNSGGANEWLGINSNSVGQLALDGVPNGAVAMVIAPGAPLTLAPNGNQLAAGCVARVQQRGTTPQNHLDYVECHSVAAASVRTAVVDNATNLVSNDQTVVLTAPEVLAAVEAPVAARISRDVIPTLQGIFGATYNSNQWGATVSASNPVLPFAAPFADTSTSPFQGVVGQTQGLLPLSRSQCAPATDPVCDPNFVHWEIATTPAPSTAPSVQKRGGSADLISFNCGASTTSQVSCTIRYGEWCGAGLGSILGSTCWHDFQASVFGNARNVGNAARSFTTAGITGFSSVVSSATPIAANAKVNADIRGNLPDTVPCNTLIILGVLIPCWSERTVTVTLPISVFPDHPSLVTLFTAGTPSAWFVNNNWHHVVYYSMAPSHAANAATHDCRTLPDCITVTGGSVAADSRAIITFAGRSLTNAARPSANLNDYLDTTENRNLNTTFEQKRFDNTFNDRFFAISNY
jgi:hypothetical protein